LYEQHEKGGSSLFAKKGFAQGGGRRLHQEEKQKKIPVEHK
jgi:hypothetical protein